MHTGKIRAKNAADMRPFERSTPMLLASGKTSETLAS